MMSEKRFTIVGEEYVGYMQGNAYIISNGECKFSLWESKEDAQKVCDCLNEQQATISALKEENERLKNKLNVTALELVGEAISMGKAVEISEMSYREFIVYRAENGKPMELQL